MNPIERNANLILKKLILSNIDQANGEKIRSLTALEPIEINDAVAHLKELGAIDVHNFLGSAPYDFGLVIVNSRGRFLYNELLEKNPAESSPQRSVGSETKIKWNQDASQEDLHSDSEPTIEKDSQGKPEPSGKPLGDIDPFVLPDHTTQKDLLDFTVYSQALASFILSKKTEKPITIGIDAPWGMGKTNLMEMICWELIRREPIGLRWCKKCGRCEKSKEYIWSIAADEAGAYLEQSRARRGLPGHLMTIWFNAWKYDQEESLWSALALEILRQIRQQATWKDQWLMAIKLNKARFDWEQLFSESLPKATLYAVVVFFVAMIVSLLRYAWTVHDFEELILKTSQDIGLPGLLAVIVLVASEFRDLYKLLLGPFNLNISQYLNSPNYQERIGFLSQFEEDFRKFIDIITRRGEKTLVIFIDDLDRCSPPKPAEIIEAINILLDSRHCVFVIGMDGKAVASSIEVKYKDLKEYLDKGGDPAGGSLGQRFLDKIIQINFRIPTLALETMNEFSKNLMPSNTLKKEQSGNSGINEEAATDEDAITQIIDFEDAFLKDPEVRKAIISVQPYLRSNPRRAKKFLNIFRLLAMIANRRALFEQGVVRLDHLAAWVIILMRWPDIIDILEIDGEMYISRLGKAQDLKGEMLISETQFTKKEMLDNLIADPKIQQMVDEKEFLMLIHPFVGHLPNYIHLAKVV